MMYWAHQDRFHEANRACATGGVKSWVNVAPCGSGKTAMMLRVVTGCVDRGHRVAIYSCRTANTAQIIQSCEEAGIRFGVVAAEFSGAVDETAPVQICQLQTVASRLGNFRHSFPHADYVLVDEAHQQTGDQAVSVFEQHLRMGAKGIIGYTATPVNCGGLYDKLVSCVTYQELLDCKAHLPAEYYGPDRPDLSQVRTTASGEYSVRTNESMNNVPFVFARVLENVNRLNPEHLPMILFAASVKHSCGHAYEFMRAGIPSAHIDGERVLMTHRTSGGALEMRDYETSQSLREDILAASRSGEIKVICNRFVLREAVDMPWLYHAIIACSMGGVATYLQSVGRVLRYWSEYGKVIVQDHGGNIDRHGLCNEEDRDWELGDTNKSMHKKLVKKRQQTKGDGAEPICCPKCNGMRTHGGQCPYCGYMHTRSVKMIRQLDGELVRKVGRDLKYKRPKSFDDYMRSAIYQSYYTCGSVKQAYQVAMRNAKRDGISARPERIWLPPSGDERWSRSTREIYDRMKPRGSR